MHHNAPLQPHPLGGGFVTTGMVAIVAALAGYLLDGHPYTRRLTPLVQPAIERFQRHQQQRQQPDVVLYDDPSDRQQQPNALHDATNFFTNTLPQTLYQCPLSGGSLNIHFPPNTPQALIFAAISLACYTLIHRCSFLRPRRDLNFLLQLQQQLQAQTTSVPTAARHCKTSEKAIRDWLHHFDEFASGPAPPGPDSA
jgi:hypothetical protein